MRGGGGLNNCNKSAYEVLEWPSTLSYIKCQIDRSIGLYA